jgi:putative endonuclease
MGCFVYMLLCADGSYYIGSATGEDLNRRVAEHETGSYPGYTFSRRPVKLIWSEHFDRSTDAIKKEALIHGDWPRIHSLAKRRGGRPRQSAKREPSS